MIKLHQRAANRHDCPQCGYRLQLKELPGLTRFGSRPNVVPCPNCRRLLIWNPAGVRRCIIGSIGVLATFPLGLAPQLFQTALGISLLTLGFIACPIIFLGVATLRLVRLQPQEGDHLLGPHHAKINTW